MVIGKAESAANMISVKICGGVDLSKNLTFEELSIPACYVQKQPMSNLAASPGGHLAHPIDSQAHGFHASEAPKTDALPKSPFKSGAGKARQRRANALLLDEGKSTSHVAEALYPNAETVREWRRMFVANGMSWLPMSA